MARVGLAQESDVPVGETRAPRAEVLVDLLVDEAFVPQHQPGDPLRGLAGVVGTSDRVGWGLDRVAVAERVAKGLAGDRIVTEEQRAVDVDQRQQRHQRPRRSSIASSCRHFGLALTVSSRKIV